MSNKHSFVPTRSHIAPPANTVSRDDDGFVAVVGLSLLIIALLCAGIYALWTPDCITTKSDGLRYTSNVAINRPYVAYDRISFVGRDGNTDVVVHINDGRVEHKLGSLAEAGEHAAVAFAGAMIMMSPDSPYNVASKIVFADNDGQTMVMIYPDGGVIHSYNNPDADTFWSAFAGRLKKIRQ